VQPLLTRADKPALGHVLVSMWTRPKAVCQCRTT